jgi:hypothetical protein
MAAHKGLARLRPRCTRSGSSVAAIPVYITIKCIVYGYSKAHISHGILTKWEMRKVCIIGRFRPFFKTTKALKESRGIALLCFSPRQ